jgi:hypothetical protein
MTIVGFNYRRVLMAAARVKQRQQIKQKTVNYELLEDILQNIKVAVDDQKYNFQQYVKAAQAEGLSQAETWKLAKEILSSHVSLRTLYRWAHEYLTEDAFDQLQSLRRKGPKSLVDKWQPELKQQIEEGKECESCPEAYEIEKVRSGAYTYEYLQSLCMWLHETLELNCRGK